MSQALLLLSILGSATPATPPPRPPVTDAALERLAISEDRLSSRLMYVIYDDPALRAEIKRVGFERGCRAVAASRNDISAKFVPLLVPATVAAIRHVIPAERLNQIWPLSFFVGPMQVYKGRVDAELDKTAQPILDTAYAEMRQTFLARVKALSATSDASANRVMPRADIAGALGITGAYDLDKPSQLGMACAEVLISPSMRPTITTTPPQPRSTVAPRR